VLVTIANIGKVLITHLTGIWLDGHVCTTVPREVTGSRKPFCTDSTLVPSFASVGQHVCLKMAKLSESFVT